MFLIKCIGPTCGRESDCSIPRFPYIKPMTELQITVVHVSAITVPIFDAQLKVRRNAH